MAGKSHSEVAIELELPGESDVWQLMTQRFEYDANRLTDQERKSMLGMELLRLNALQAAVWPSAMMGDPVAVRTATEIVKTRVKITGLEQVDPVVNKNLVLVMGDKEDEYIASLAKVASASQDD